MIQIIGKVKFMAAALLVAASTLSCNNDIEEGQTAPPAPSGEEQDGGSTVLTMKLDVAKAGFDQGGGTRAEKEEWEDGDVIYLRFHNADGIVTGYAAYDAAKYDWNVRLYGALDKDAMLQVEVVYIYGQPLQTTETVAIDANSVPYEDKNGTFRLHSDGNVLEVQALLRPITGRIHLDTAGTGVPHNLTLRGISWYSAYNPESGEFIVTDEPREWYHTEYIYGILNDSRSIVVERWVDISEEEFYQKNGIYSSTKRCTVDVLAIGKSGRMALPSLSAAGWTHRQLSGYSYRGEFNKDLIVEWDDYKYLNYGYWVDLELPSGRLWAESDNYGGSVIHHAETGDRSYLHGTLTAATTCQWDRTKWKLPTKADYEELIANTTFRWHGDSYGTSYGEFTAENGCSVIFRAAGYGPNAAERDEKGYYFTSDGYVMTFSATEPPALQMSAGSLYSHRYVRK